MSLTKDRSIKAVIERLRFGDSDGDDHDIAAAELSKPAHEREPPHCSTCSCGAHEPRADLRSLLSEAREAAGVEVLGSDLDERIGNALNRTGDA